MGRLLALCASWILLAPAATHAAGLFLAPPGVRPLARGGAFVAGADDLDALSYNPAGLAFAADGALVAFAWPMHRTEFERRVDANGEPMPTAYGRDLGLPSPTLGAAQHIVPGLVVGMGLVSDYPLLQNWPDTLDDGSPAPQRYSVYNYRGTAVGKFALGLAYAIGDSIALGASVHVFGGTFASEVATSTCDGVVCTQPENPEFDARVQIIARNIAVPGAEVGLIVAPWHWLRLGVAWQSGHNVDKEAELRLRLPDAPVYDDAWVEPEEARGRVRMRLPMALRAGIEGRFGSVARLEAAFVYEPWSVLERIEVEADNIVVHNVTGVGDYRAQGVSLERDLHDTWSVRLGGELTPNWPAAKTLVLRAGAAYEPSASPKDKLSAMAVDLDKLVVALGVSYRLSRFTVEATYAHVFMASVVVDDSRVLQVNPSRPPWPGRTPVGNGRYASSADILGAGIRLDW